MKRRFWSWLGVPILVLLAVGCTTAPVALTDAKADALWASLLKAGQATADRCRDVDGLGVVQYQKLLTPYGVGKAPGLRSETVAAGLDPADINGMVGTQIYENYEPVGAQIVRYYTLTDGVWLDQDPEATGCSYGNFP